MGMAANTRLLGDFAEMVSGKSAVVYPCLFGKFCCILREKHLPGDCVRGRILLENKGVPH